MNFLSVNSLMVLLLKHQHVTLISEMSIRGRVCVFQIQRVRQSLKTLYEETGTLSIDALLMPFSRCPLPPPCRPDNYSIILFPSAPSTSRLSDLQFLRRQNFETQVLIPVFVERERRECLPTVSLVVAPSLLLLL